MIKESKVRYARMPFTASCLLVIKGESFVTEVKNISASGILLEYERQHELKIKDFCVLEIIINEEFNLNVEAEVRRINNNVVALEFKKIPEEKQIPLWKLLGEHVDKIES